MHPVSLCAKLRAWHMLVFQNYLEGWIDSSADKKPLPHKHED